MSWLRRLLRGDAQNPENVDRKKVDSIVDAPVAPPQVKTEATNDVVYDHTEQNQNGATYEVHRGATRDTALTYLRKREITREQYYVIVETAQGNVGKDFIMIFEESAGKFIELGVRKPLAAFHHSPTDCARCGYPVPPKGYSSPSLPNITGAVVVVRYIVHNHDEELMRGTGYQCRKCGSLSCAICYGPSDELPRDPTGKLQVTCWCCSNEMGVFYESESR